MKNNFIYLFLIVFLSSCGGGGGNSSNASPSASVTLSSNSYSILIGSEITLNWSSLNTSSCIASGAWTGNKPISGNEVITISIPGNNIFTLTCTGSGGSSSSTIAIEGYREINGVAVDGYIRSSDIFIDENNNYVIDINENTDISNNNGQFTIKHSNGNLISLGGFDLDTGNLLSNFLMLHKVTGYSEYKVITPLTSIEAFMIDSSNINIMLGLDNSIDIFSDDPVFLKGFDDKYNYLYEKGNQLTILAYSIQNIINLNSISSNTTQNIFKIIAQEIELDFNESQSKVDIENLDFIDRVFNSILDSQEITLDQSVKDNLSLLLKSLIPIFEARSDDNLNVALFNFALTTFQEDIASITNNTLDDEVLNEYTNNVLNYIAIDQNIDADELAPNITAFDNNALINEDTKVLIDVLNNDSYISFSPISITATDPLNGSVSIIDGLIEYIPNQDFNGSDSFIYTIYQGNKNSSAEVTIAISPVNDAPVINTNNVVETPENQNFVIDLDVSDVDIGDILVTTISGVDSSLFILNESNELNFISPPDFESTNSFNITISVTDGILVTSKDINIQVTNVNDIPPVIVSDSDFTSKEMCTSVTFLEANDVEGDLLMWSLSGDNSSDFIIDIETGHLEFSDYPKLKTLDDGSINNTYSITAEVFDGVHTVNQDINIVLQYDPLYPHQWVLENTGQKNFADLPSTAGADINIIPSNCSYTGKGVTVAIIDTGLELSHKDLVDNVIDGSIDWVNSDDDPSPESLSGDHGTACAGIIAMKGHNDIGGRGIASDANLVGYNWLNSQSDSNLLSSFTGNDYAVDLGVTNNSWGRGLGNYYMPPEWDIDVNLAMETIIAESRSGKGTINVKSNGNSFYSSDGWCGPNNSMDDDMPCTTASSSGGLHTTPFIVGVPSLNANDERSSYSTVGPSSWIAGYGGEFGYGPPNYLAENYSAEQQRYFKAAVMSTDQSSCDVGYVRTENDPGTPRNAFSTGDHPLNLDCDYMPHMNGTSAAGPTVAGVIALLLEVNPNFTWRDIKHILANTGKIVDETRSKVLSFNSTDISMHSWITNAAGYNHHNWFGFGKLDVNAAITFAKNMTPNSLGDFNNYDLVSMDSEENDWNMEIADEINISSINIPQDNNANGKVEWVKVRVWFDYPDMSDIGLRLTSPDGTTLNILYPFAYKTMNPKDLVTLYDFEEYYFDIGIAGFYGENFSGDWTLEVINWESGGCPEVTDDDGNVTTICTSGSLENWGILMYGN